MRFLSVVTTVKASTEAICHFVDYHRNAGVQKIRLFFDDPEGGQVLEVASRYGDLVEAYDCSGDYWNRRYGLDRPHSVEERQRRNADFALELARSFGERWIAHVDVDEYIYVGGGDIARGLKGLPEEVDLVHLEVLEAIPRCLEAVSPSRMLLFKSLPFEIGLADSRYSLSVRIRRALLLSLYKGLFIATRVLGIASEGRGSIHDYFNAHSIGKCITRVSGKVLSLRLHFPWFREGTPIVVFAGSNFRMLHFESSSFEEWMAKWRRRSTKEGFAAALDRRQKVIFDRFMASSGDVDQLRILYKDLYFIEGRRLGFLRAVGLVKVAPIVERERDVTEVESA